MHIAFLGTLIYIGKASFIHLVYYLSECIYDQFYWIIVVMNL